MKKTIIGAIILAILISVSSLSAVPAAASEVSTETVVPVVIPQKVTELKASIINVNDITLTWTAQDKSIGYQVYKYNTTKRTYKKVGKTLNNYYKVKKLQSGVQYKFMVVAYKNVVKAKGVVIKAKTIVPQVSNVSTKSASNTSLTLNWKKTGSVSGYRIWVYDSSKKAYVKRADVKGKNTSYTDSSLASASKYKYKISAYQIVSGKRVYSSASTCTAITKPDQVTISSLNQNTIWYNTDDGGLAYYAVITLKWNKVSSATGYQVYMYDSGVDQYVKVKDTKSTTYKPSDFASYHTYRYKVRAYKIVSGQKIYGSFSSASTTITKEAGSRDDSKWLYNWNGYKYSDLDLIVGDWLYGGISTKEALKELKEKFPTIEKWTFKKYSNNQYMQGYQECGNIDYTRYFVSVYTGSSNGTYGFFYGR